MFPGLMQQFGRASQPAMPWGGLLQQVQPQAPHQWGGWAGANRGYAAQPQPLPIQAGMIPPPQQPGLQAMPMGQPNIAPGMQGQGGMYPGLQQYNGPMMNLGMSGMRY